MLLTARNDGLMNTFKPVRLSAWHANAYEQYCVSCHKVTEYCAKYATKCEPCSWPLKEIFTAIVRNLTSLKAVQKLLINSVGGTNQHRRPAISSLQVPMFRASHDIVKLSLDWSRAVEEHLARRPASNGTVSTRQPCRLACNSTVSGHDTAALCPPLHHAQGVWI